MKLLIGLTCGLNEDKYYLTTYYSDALLKLGAVPIILPYTSNPHSIKQYAELIDGLILTGGGDIDPVYFGEEPNSNLGAICPERDQFEFKLLKLLFKTKKPILGICRGMQVLNIAAGGTLWQDITERKERAYQHIQNAPKWYVTHQIRIKEESRLADIYIGRKKIRVNSFHHQAVKDIAVGYDITALSQDGIIEGIEALDYKVFRVGVQWHPECLWQKESLNLNLFQALIEACKQQKG